jgi:hypothetical protein
MRPIYVFVRHCAQSSNSVNKGRPSWFTKERALCNLLSTKDHNTHVTILLDTASTPDASSYFAYNYNVKVVEAHGGTDAHSFINLINYVCNQGLPDDSIIYLLEDDYIHKQGWTDVLREAFDAKIAPYVTLYDHPDKYFMPLYKNLVSKLFVTPSCHWRTTPSTTNTYASLFSTLKHNKEIHLRFSDTKVGFTFDHQKFVYLAEKGQILVSSVPGFSTHVENGLLSPIEGWHKYMNANGAPRLKEGGMIGL